LPLPVSNPQKINTIFIQTTSMSSYHVTTYPGGGLDIVSTAAASGAYATASPISTFGDKVFVEVASITNQHKFSITDDVSGALLGNSSSTGSATPVVIPITFTTIPHTTGIRITIECLDPSGGTVSKPYIRVPVDSVVPRNIVSTVCNGNRYRYGYNGKMKDNEWAGLGNNYDFGARLYDPRIGRWLSMDPLAAKYPGHSPYNFVTNSPIIFKDYDGKDFGLAINHQAHSIVVTPTYYTVDDKSYKQAQNAATDLNAYKANVSIDGVNYTMPFEAKAIPPEAQYDAFSPALLASNRAEADDQGNLYSGTILPPKGQGGNPEGGLTRGDKIAMRQLEIEKPGEFPYTADGRDDPKKLNHEMLHTMGNDDHAGGRMEYVPVGSEIRDVSVKDIQQIVDYARKNNGKDRASTGQLQQMASITQSGDGDISSAEKVKVTNVEKKIDTK
jgi:RHS repeat-associated protein